MGTQPPHAGVEPGDGIVGRYGDTCVVVAAPGGGAQQFTSDLLAVLDGGGQGSVASSEDLAWQVARLLVAHSGAAPAFGVVARSAEGYLLLLHGPVRAQATGPGGDLELSGGGSATWLDRVVLDPISRLAVTLTDSGPVRADPRSNLLAGLVPGAGLVLTLDPADQPAAPAEPDRPVTSGAGPRSTLEATEPPVVGGRTTTEGHEPSSTETRAVRVQSVGALVADDGTSTPLDRAYVLGREPQQDPSVQLGEASPIVVRDPDNLVSRVQVRVSVDAQGGVTLSDCGSANGTFVAAPGATDWVRLGEEATALPPGWSMRLGRRVFTHVRGTSS